MAIIYIIVARLLGTISRSWIETCRLCQVDYRSSFHGERHCWTHLCWLHQHLQGRQSKQPRLCWWRSHFPYCEGNWYDNIVAIKISSQVIKFFINCFQEAIISSVKLKMAVTWEAKKESTCLALTSICQLFRKRTSLIFFLELSKELIWSSHLSSEMPPQFMKSVKSSVFYKSNLQCP